MTADPNPSTEREAIYNAALVAEHLATGKETPGFARRAALRAMRALSRPLARKMVSGDLFHRSEHRFPEDCWSGGRTECRCCGVFLNSFYDDEDGCHGPWWMRHQDGGGRAE